MNTVAEPTQNLMKHHVTWVRVQVCPNLCTGSIPQTFVNTAIQLEFHPPTHPQIYTMGTVCARMCTVNMLSVKFQGSTTV